jgi:asparagine synthase (glutamine-hydrolysing)
MCGIAGYWGAGSREVLESMGGAIRHRGPDDQGFFEQGPVGFVHRRLSIVDLSPAGHQPMTTNDGAITIVFNGEIYNHQELRNTYLSKQSFRGTSDTEVILYLYEKFGVSFLEMIQGMFALCIYDARNGKLLLARDRLGKKPLYWTRQGNTLIFASELKALRMHPKCPNEVSRHALAQYLVYEYVPGPSTIYEGVHKLESGTYLTFNGAELQHGVYHNFKSKLGSYTNGFSGAQKELENLLAAAVKKRMVADVPVGVFLSGGLDSSTVAYFAQKETEHRVKTFSIGFEDASFDESTYAREVAKFLDTEHHERIVGPQDLLAVVGQLPKVLDEPMADSSIIPTMLLSELTSSEVKVALGGDGADELFWGYGTFFAHRIGGWYEKVPGPALRAMGAFAQALPVSHTYMSFDFKLKKFVSGFNTERARRNTRWLSAFAPEELQPLLTYTVDMSTLLYPSDRWYGERQQFWDSLQTEYLRGYLTEDILVKTDRAGMAHGLEVRAPFLDTDLVNFALTLSPTFKLHNGTGKYVLKEVMRKHLPRHIVMRSKKGFNMPIGSWIRNELKEVFTEVILDGRLVESGLFSREALAILLESHMSGRVDNRKKLWTLFVLAKWMEEWYG